MNKNVAGDIGSGNAQDGFRVTGNNGALSENTSRSNGGVGFNILSTGHKLTKDIGGGTASQSNGGCEFVINASNTDGTGNKANNNAFTFTLAAGKSCQE